MQALAAAELLSIWEDGQQRSPLLRALTLLAAACPDTSAEALARLPVGQRDALLFELRARTFGSKLTAVAPCPACGQTLDLEFDAAQLRSAPAGDRRP